MPVTVKAISSQATLIVKADNGSDVVVSVQGLLEPEELREQLRDILRRAVMEIDAEEAIVGTELQGITEEGPTSSEEEDTGTTSIHSVEGKAVRKPPFGHKRK